MAILTLALGVGATTAVFSFVDALLLREPPGVAAGGGALVSVYTGDFSSGPYGSTSYPDFESIQTDTSAFTALAAEDGSTVAPIRIGDDTARIRVSRVSASYFNVIGTPPLLGRPIVEGDVSPAPPAVGVVSAALWQRSFGGDPAIIGTTVTLDGHPIEIVGVAPERFQGLDLGRVIDIWIPLASSLRDACRARRIAACPSSDVSSRACRSAKRRLSSRRSLRASRTSTRPPIWARSNGRAIRGRCSCGLPAGSTRHSAVRC